MKTHTILNVILRQIDGLAPTFSKKPSIKQEDDGKRLLFECIIQADPKPTIAWIHGGKPVIDSPRHKVWKILIFRKASSTHI